MPPPVTQPQRPPIHRHPHRPPAVSLLPRKVSAPQPPTRSSTFRRHRFSPPNRFRTPRRSARNGHSPAQNRPPPPPPLPPPSPRCPPPGCPPPRYRPPPSPPPLLTPRQRFRRHPTQKRNNKVRGWASGAGIAWHAVVVGSRAPRLPPPPQTGWQRRHSVLTHSAQPPPRSPRPAARASNATVSATKPGARRPPVPEPGSSGWDGRFRLGAGSTDERGWARGPWRAATCGAAAAAHLAIGLLLHQALGPAQ
jgi:hypothetical protein